MQLPKEQNTVKAEPSILSFEGRPLEEGSLVYISNEPSSIYVYNPNKLTIGKVNQHKVLKDGSIVTKIFEGNRNARRQFLKVFKKEVATGNYK